MTLRNLLLWSALSLLACSRDSRSTDGADLSGAGQLDDLAGFLSPLDGPTTDGMLVDLEKPPDLAPGPPVCGDGLCNGTETNATCPGDCTSTVDTCATLPPCATGARYFILYTQDISALCADHVGECQGGSSGCKIDNSVSPIGMCLTTSPATYCPTTSVAGGHTVYTDCA